MNDANLQIICLYCTNSFLVDGQAHIKTCWK